MQLFTYSYYYTVVTVLKLGDITIKSVKSLLVLVLLNVSVKSVVVSMVQRCNLI